MSSKPVESRPPIAPLATKGEEVEFDLENFYFKRGTQWYHLETPTDISEMTKADKQLLLSTVSKLFFDAHKTDDPKFKQATLSYNAYKHSFTEITIDTTDGGSSKIDLSKTDLKLAPDVATRLNTLAKFAFKVTPKAAPAFTPSTSGTSATTSSSRGKTFHLVEDLVPLSKELAEFHSLDKYQMLPVLGDGHCAFRAFLAAMLLDVVRRGTVTDLVTYINNETVKLSKDKSTQYLQDYQKLLPGSLAEIQDILTELKDTPTAGKLIEILQDPKKSNKLVYFLRLLSCVAGATSNVNDARDVFFGDCEAEAEKKGFTDKKQLTQEKAVQLYASDIMRDPPPGEKPGPKWGGNSEFYALGRFFNCDVYVYKDPKAVEKSSAKKPASEREKVNRLKSGSKKPGLICLHYESESHYNVIVPPPPKIVVI